MTDELRSVGPVESREQHREGRQGSDRRAEERRAAPASRSLVPTDLPPDAAAPPARAAAAPPSDAAAAAFAAQMLGQSGQRRGLKGGPPVLEAARSAYLGTKHSGVGERRPQPGKAKDTDV